MGRRPNKKKETSKPLKKEHRPKPTDSQFYYLIGQPTIQAEPV